MIGIVKMVRYWQDRLEGNQSCNWSATTVTHLTWERCLALRGLDKVSVLSVFRHDYGMVLLLS